MSDLEENTGVKCENCGIDLKRKEIIKGTMQWIPCECQAEEPEFEGKSHPVTGKLKPGKSPFTIQVKGGESQKIVSPDFKENSPLFFPPGSLTPSRIESQNSFEFGKAGNRHKIYYSTQEEFEHKVRHAIKMQKLAEELKGDNNAK